MRFKQALSRKLAAALSAVMILSTIAPTSVPVLAAAPDDVLVDSAAEYSLTDAGSEDLSTPAESSLAEESDALEVAEEELLTSEPASEETIVEAADIAAETGAEPAETVDVAEGAAPEGFFTISFDGVSQNIIKSITLVSGNEAEGLVPASDGKTVYDEWPIVATVSAGSIVSIDEITLNDYWDKDDVELKLGDDVISANTPDLDLTLTPGITGNMTIDSLSITPKTFNVNVPLKVTSGNIITGLEYTVDDVSSEYPVATSVTVSENISETIKLTDARSISIGNITVTSEYDEKYKITVNNTDVISDNTTLAAYEKVLSDNAALKQGFNITAERTAFDGKVTLNVVSNNLITGVMYSIDGTTPPVEAEIVNNKAEIDYTNANTFEIVSINYVNESKKAGVDVKIGDKTIAAGATFDPIEYIITKQAPGKGTPITITGEATKNTKDITFTLNVVSNNKITSFDYDVAAPVYGTPTTETVSKNQYVYTFEESKSVKLSGFVATDVANKGTAGSKGALKITYNGKTEYVYPDTFFEIVFPKDADSVEATLTYVPFVKVTLSGNKIKDKYASNGNTGTYYFEGGAYDTVPGYIAFDGNDAFDIYVEPSAASLSLNNIYGKESYMFPAFKGADDKDIKVYTSLTGDMWKLGKFNEDTVITAYAKAFILDNNQSIITTSTPGKVETGYTAGTVEVVKDDLFNLSNNKVFSSSSDIAMEITPENKDPKVTNRISKVGYSFYDVNGITPIELKEGDSWVDDESFEQNDAGNRKISIQIPNYRVRGMLLNDGKLDIAATQTSVDKKYEVRYYGSNISSVEVKDSKGVVIMSDYPVCYHEVGYDDEISITAKASDGFKIISMNVVYTDSTLSSNDFMEKDAGKLAALADKGYKLKVKGNVNVTFVTDTDNYVDVQYEDKEGTNRYVAKDKKGNYVINHRRKAEVVYYNGYVAKDFSYDVIVNKKSLKDEALSANAIKYDTANKKLVFDGSYKNFVGKNVTVKVWTGDGKDTDTSLKTLIFAVDAEKTGVTFKNKGEEEIAVGTSKSFAASVVGTPSITAVLSWNTLPKPHITGSWNESKKTLTVYTYRNTPAGSYTFNLVDSYDKSIIYGSKTVKLTTTDVENAKVVSKVTNTTNHKITLSLTTNADAKTDGLFYRVKINVANRDKKTPGGRFYYTDKIDTLVPLSSKSETFDILNPEILALGKDNNEYKIAIQDYDPKAEISVEVSLWQTKVAYPYDDTLENAIKDENKVATTKTPVSISSKDIKIKEGKVFETKLKLKKITKGNVFTNMGDDVLHIDPYEVGVVWGKNTGVCELQNVELLDADGNHYEDFVDWTDSSVIKIYPYNNNIPAGKYTLKAYALEPDGIDVVATMKLTVVQAIEELSIMNAPKYIYKANGKPATVKLAAYDTTNGAVAAKLAKKVEWSFLYATGISYTAKDITINKKNGTLKISKNIAASEVNNIQIHVRAKAADYAANKVATQYVITLKPYSKNALKMQFTNEEPTDTSEWTTLESGKKILVNDMFGDLGKDEAYKGYKYVAYVTVYEQSTEYNANKYYVPATFKVSGAKLLDTYTNEEVKDGNEVRATIAVIGFTKVGTVKITATADDGSGRAFKGKEVMQIPVDYTDEKSVVGFKVYNKYNDDPIREYYIDSPATSLSVDNFSAAGETLTLKLFGSYKDSKGTKRDSLVNHKVKVTNKGGKVTAVKNAPGYYTVTPTSNETKIEVTKYDGKKAGSKYTINIKNYAIAASTTKTKAKVTATTYGNAKAKGTIYSHLHFEGAEAAGFAGYTSCNKVTYKVDGVTKSADNKTYVLVESIPDKKGNIDGAIDGALYKSRVASVDEYTYVMELNDSNSFVVDYVGDDGNFDAVAKSQKIKITPVTKVDGHYVASNKPADFTIKTVKAPKAICKMATSVTVTSGNSVTIGKKSSKNVIGDKYVFVSDAEKQIGLLNVNTKGRMNHFKTLFRLGADGKLQFVGGTIDGKAKDSIDPTNKEDKPEFSGYVKYQYQGLDGTINDGIVKVTVKTVKNAKLSK